MRVPKYDDTEKVDTENVDDDDLDSDLKGVLLESKICLAKAQEEPEKAIEALESKEQRFAPIIINNEKPVPKSPQILSLNVVPNSGSKFTTSTLIDPPRESKSLEPTQVDPPCESNVVGHPERRIGHPKSLLAYKGSAVGRWVKPKMSTDQKLNQFTQGRVVLSIDNKAQRRVSNLCVVNTNPNIDLTNAEAKDSVDKASKEQNSAKALDCPAIYLRFSTISQK